MPALQDDRLDPLTNHTWVARIELPASSEAAAELALTGTLPPETEVPVTAVYCTACLTDYSDEALVAGCSGEPLQSPR